MSDMTKTAYESEDLVNAFVDKEQVNHDKRERSFLEFYEGINFVGKSLLDVGCGYGRDVEMFSKLGANAEGCDYSEVMVKQSQNRYPNHVFKVCDLYHLSEKYPVNSFDIVSSCAVLVHVPKQDTAKVIKEMHKILKPSGLLMLSTKAGDEEMVTDHLYKDLPRLMVYRTNEEMVKTFVQLGFKIIKEASLNIKNDGGNGDWLRYVLQRI